MSFTYRGLKATLDRHIVTGEEIDRQMERAAISSTYGFAMLFPQAARVLKTQ